MKKVFNSLFVIIAAMVTFAGCAKQEIDAPATPETKTVQFFANSIETKTHFGDSYTENDKTLYPTLWTADDKVSVTLNFGERKSSSNFECSDNFKSAHFLVDGLEIPEEGPYTFYSVSPADKLKGVSSNYSRLLVEIPASQTPLETSVDENAQLLYASSETTEVLLESVVLNYQHLTAYGKLSLTNLTSNVTSVSCVKIEAPEGVYLAGKWDYFVEDGSFIVRSGQGQRTITLTTENTTDIWFACAPVDVSNKTLTLTVTTDKGDLVKELAFPDGRKFEAGRIAKFNVNMAGIEVKEEEPEQPDGGETTSTIVFSEYGFANGESVNGKSIAIDDNITATFAKGKSSNDPAYYDSGSAIRMYQNGATLDIDANGKVITKIELTFAQNHYYIAADSGELSAEAAERTWTGSATAVKFTSTGTDKNHRAYVSKIVVTYGAGGETPEPEEPVEPEEPETPAGPIKISIAEFNNLNGNETTIYELTGEVKKIYNEYSSQYKNISFYINDDTAEVLIYRMSCEEDLGNAIRVGDKITVQGTPTIYEGKIQMAQGGICVEHIAAPFAQFGEQSVIVDANTNTYVLKVKSNTEWTLTPSNGVTLSQTTGTGNADVTMTFAANESTEQLTYTVTITFETSEATFTLYQSAPQTGNEPKEETATLSFANKAQRTTYTTSQQVWEQNGITFTNDKSASTTNVADYANPVRLYANSKVTVAAPGNITKIVFDCNSASYATAMKNSIGTPNGATVTVSSDKVTVTFSNDVESFVVAKLTAQVRMDSLTVTYLQ